MTGILFKIPYLRHLYSYVMAGDVGKKNFLRILDEGGTAVFIPGGVQVSACGLSCAFGGCARAGSAP
jgi:hypothetical protein